MSKNSCVWISEQTTKNIGEIWKILLIRNFLKFLMKWKYYLKSKKVWKSVTASLDFMVRSKRIYFFERQNNLCLEKERKNNFFAFWRSDPEPFQNWKNYWFFKYSNLAKICYNFWGCDWRIGKIIIDLTGILEFFLEKTLSTKSNVFCL